MPDLNLIIAASFVGVFTMVLGAYWAFIVVPERRGQGAVRRRLKWESADPTDPNVGLLKKQQVLSTIDSLNVLLKRTEKVSGPLKELIDQAGIPLTVGSFLLITLTAFLGGLVLVQWYIGIWWLSLIAGGVAAIVPFVVVNQIRTMRIQKFEEQFPRSDSVDRPGHARRPCVLDRPQDGGRRTAAAVRPRVQGALRTAELRRAAARRVEGVCRAYSLARRPVLRDRRPDPA
jgi:hypothetical protein